MRNQKRYIVSKTPLRVSFAGGGSDLPQYYENSEKPGRVISTAVDKFVYVTVKSHGETFEERIRLNYSITEVASKRSELKNDIIRSCLEYLEIDDPIYISSVSDVPAGSGLGSSSAFAVGLLNCLHRYKGDPQLSSMELAAEAAHIELDYVRSPIGLQDHFGCAVGGLKSIQFNKNRRVDLQVLDIAMKDLRGFFESVQVFWTGTMRSANDVLVDQASKTKRKISDLEKMVDIAVDMQKYLSSDFDVEKIGGLLHEGWELKRTLSERISYTQVDKYYELAMDHGALGGKLLGAGGGGFLLLVVPPSKQPKIESLLKDFRVVKFAPVIAGSEILIG